VYAIWQIQRRAHCNFEEKMSDMHLDQDEGRRREICAHAKSTCGMLRCQPPTPMAETLSPVLLPRIFGQRKTGVALNVEVLLSLAYSINCPAQHSHHLRRLPKLFLQKAPSYP